MTTRHAGIALLSALAVAGVEAEARACSLAPPGIYARTVFPGQDTHPPVNTRVIVRYQLGPTGYGTQPAPIGPDLVLLDLDGTVVPTTQEIAGGDVILRPDAPLLPNHGYQVADRRTVPCTDVIALEETCVLADAPVAFASFTTGAAADGTAPTFAGIASSSVGTHDVCDNSVLRPVRHPQGGSGVGGRGRRRRGSRRSLQRVSPRRRDADAGRDVGGRNQAGRRGLVQRRLGRPQPDGRVVHRPGRRLRRQRGHEQRGAGDW